MKVARIYLRVSTDEQDLARQAEIEQSTRSSGYYIAGVYREKASGARADRPELLRMIADRAPPLTEEDGVEPLREFRNGCGHAGLCGRVGNVGGLGVRLLTQVRTEREHGQSYGLNYGGASQAGRRDHRGPARNGST
jgi:hypothetical protein